MSYRISMIYINITSFGKDCERLKLEKDCSMIETLYLKNVLFFQTISSFVLPRKIIYICNGIAEKMEMLQLNIFKIMKKLQGEETETRHQFS